MENIYQEPAFIREGFKIIESISKQLIMIKTGEIIDCFTAEYEQEGFDLLSFSNYIYAYNYVMRNTKQYLEQFWFTKLNEGFGLNVALKQYSSYVERYSLDEKGIEFYLLERNLKAKIREYIKLYYNVLKNVPFQIKEKIRNFTIENDTDRIFTLELLSMDNYQEYSSLYDFFVADEKFLKEAAQVAEKLNITATTFDYENKEVTLKELRILWNCFRHIRKDIVAFNRNCLPEPRFMVPIRLSEIILDDSLGGLSVHEHGNFKAALDIMIAIKELELEKEQTLSKNLL